MLKLIKFSVLLIVTYTLLVKCEKCEPEKINFNYVFNSQVVNFATQLIAFKKNYINMNKMKFNIDGIEADGVKLYDTTQLIPKEAKMWTAPNDTQHANITFGLKSMRLEIGSLKYKGNEYKNATIEVTDAFLNTDQVTQYKSDICTMEYSNIGVFTVSKALLNNETDVIEDINNVVIPWVNQQLRTDNFQKIVLKYFNNCNSQANNNLIQLLIEPYSD